MKAYQQGQGDGLCGLYSVMHFLTITPEFGAENPEDILWYLLDGARHFGWLNPYTLTQGFEDFQLKSILDLQIDNYRMNYKTYLLAEARKSVKIKSAKSLIEAVVAKDGSAIVSSKRRNHWLFVTNDHGKARVIDSANAASPVGLLEDKPRSFSPDWGVVVLPHKRTPLDLDL